MLRYSATLKLGMSNPNPNPATRFQPGVSGNKGGVPSRQWLKKLMSSRHKDAQTAREAIAQHLIEVATSWQIIHLGKEYAVASGRDAVDAARLLYAYDQGKPPDKDPLKLAEHFRQVERDRMDVALKLLGDRINSWAPEKVRDFLLQCARDPRGFMQAAEEYLAGGASGGNPAVAETQPIEAEPDAPVSMILGGPADARAGETPPSIVSVQQGPPGGSTKEYLGTKEEEAQALPDAQAEQPQALPVKEPEE